MLCCGEEEKHLEIDHAAVSNSRPDLITKITEL